MDRLLYIVAIFSGLMALGGLAFFSTVSFFSLWGARKASGRPNESAAAVHVSVVEEAGHPGLFSRISQSFEQACKRREAQAEEKRRRLAEQEQLRRDELARARSGALEPVYDCVSILQKGETAYFTIRASLAEVKNVGYRGRSAGVSFRVAKGVTLRTGGFGGQAVKQLVTSATGQLSVTNKRLLFAGDAKSRATKLNKIVSVERFNDGLGIHEDNKSTVYMVQPGHKLDVLEAFIGRLASEA